MATTNGIILYRAAERVPPRDKEYLTPAAKGRKPREGATEEELRSHDALSSWDTAEAALRVAERMRSARWVVAYNMEELKGYLMPGFKVEVRRKETGEQ